MKNLDKRKFKTIKLILGIVFLATTFYYFFYSFIENGGTINMCQNIICTPILSLSEFLSITTGLFGLFLVVDSLDSWKNQDAYHNSRDINFELKEYIYACEISTIIKIMELPKHLPIEEKRKEIKRILPSSGIGSPISDLCHKIKYENIYYREEFKELSKIIEKVIFNMWNIINNEGNDFTNIDSRIQIATRNDLEKATQLNSELRDKLYDLTA